MKFCKDCRWFHKSNEGVYNHMCHHHNSEFDQNPVDGSYMYHTCYCMRTEKAGEYNKWCGEEARFWEPRDK